MEGARCRYLSAGIALRAVRVQPREYLPPSTRAAAQPATNLLVPSAAWASDHDQPTVGGGAPVRLSAHVLDHGLAAAAQGTGRGHDPCRSRGASADHFCTRGCFGPTERVLLLVATTDCAPARHVLVWHERDLVDVEHKFRKPVRHFT